jgi:hypothetical protein
MRSKRRCRDMYRMLLYLGEGVYQLKSYLRDYATRAWKVEAGTIQHDKRTIYCAIAGAVQRRIQVYYIVTSSALSMGIMVCIAVPRLHVAAVRISGSNHTACEPCHSCLVHRLPLVVRGQGPIDLEGFSCEVVQSEWLHDGRRCRVVRRYLMMSIASSVHT